MFQLCGRYQTDRLSGVEASQNITFAIGRGSSGENYSGVRLTNPQAWRRDPVHETVIIHLARSRE